MIAALIRSIEPLDYSNSLVVLVYWGALIPIMAPGDRPMPATATRNQGKSMFIKEVLNNDAFANHEAVNKAWRAAGMSGTISPTLVSRMRSRMGLAGNLGRGRRRKSKAAGTRGGRPAEANGSTRVMGRGKRNNLLDLEIDIDRLLMKVVEIGTLPDVENDLRRARRHLYAGMIAQS
jgi:hypothetical protein